MTVDLKKVSTYYDCPKLNYEDSRVVKQIVQPNDNFIMIDIKSGYHHVPVATQSQHYLGIYWQGRPYVWQL